MLWTVPRQAPLCMGFSGQEYWSGLPFSSPGDPSDPGIEPRSPALQGDLGQEDPLEEGVATHSSILAQRIPWTEEPGGLQSMGFQRASHD